MSRYCSLFPENFEKDILPKGAKKQNIDVYRIIKFVYDDRDYILRDNFLSTYEEVKKRLRPKGKNFDENNPSTYSTSCNITLKDAEKILKMMMRHYPRPFIAKGITKEECGPCQLTFERTNEKKDRGHIDWWIYEKATPQNYFKEVNGHD